MNVQAGHSSRSDFSGHSGPFEGVSGAGTADGEEIRNLQMRLDDALRSIERLEAFVSVLEEKLLERDWRYRRGSLGSRGRRAD